MFVKYMRVRASNEGDLAGWNCAYDYLAELCWLDYDQMECNECLWIVPGTYNGE